MATPATDKKPLSKSRFYDMTVVDRKSKHLLFPSLHIEQQLIPLKKTTEKGEWYSLDNNRDKVVLIVNTASKCGFTPQYKGLETLYKELNAKYGEGKFEILAFPCNQFFKQEPGSNAEIEQFCETKYKVTFPVFAKIDVNGPLASPLYKWLKTQRKGFLGVGRIGWNFTKVRPIFFVVQIVFASSDTWIVCY